MAKEKLLVNLLAKLIETCVDTHRHVFQGIGDWAEAGAALKTEASGLPGTVGYDWSALSETAVPRIQSKGVITVFTIHRDVIVGPALGHTSLIAGEAPLSPDEPPAFTLKTSIDGGPRQTVDTGTVGYRDATDSWFIKHVETAQKNNGRGSDVL